MLFYRIGSDLSACIITVQTHTTFSVNLTNLSFFLFTTDAYPDPFPRPSIIDLQQKRDRSFLNLQSQLSMKLNPIDRKQHSKQRGKSVPSVLDLQTELRQKLKTMNMNGEVHQQESVSSSQIVAEEPLYDNTDFSSFSGEGGPSFVERSSVSKNLISEWSAEGPEPMYANTGVSSFTGKSGPEFIEKSHVNVNPRSSEVIYQNFEKTNQHEHIAYQNEEKGNKVEEEGDYDVIPAFQLYEPRTYTALEDEGAYYKM